MRNEYPLYLNGAWTPQTDGCVREDIEPATGKPLFTVHRAEQQAHRRGATGQNRSGARRSAGR